MIHFKRFAYFLWQTMLKTYWRWSGGRREKAMGLVLNLHPATVWPGHRGLRLPQGDYRSRIVAFADLVQAHVVCNAVASNPPPSVIIDVGAHHGEYVVLLGGLLKARSGVMIAVEPDTVNISILKSNIARNTLQNVVHVVESAVSEVTGEMDFVSQGSESRMLASGDVAGTGAVTRIKVETLRGIISRFQLDKVDLLLVDVEGTELLVLKGFPWETMQPTMILVELHPYNWPIFGYTGRDMTDFLQEHQYRCLDMYLQEYSRFDSSSYIGPCLFLPR